ncbi:hypothetical protein [Kitasatospora fiedleri]|uniref:hypothetical protein n=1 Tax=Kitasatospora fiedleri TaxID=2991545 RepID=UPI00249B8A01|nr:hypothetical protein [Kitasatospora fiedleri]
MTRIRPDAERLYRTVVDDACTRPARPFMDTPYPAGHIFGPYDNVAQALAQKTVVENAGGTAHVNETELLEWGEWFRD